MGAKDRFKDQSGTALVISLIMIVVLTLIGLASIFASTFETSLSGNKRLSTDSFYIAETRTNATVRLAQAIDDIAKENPGDCPYPVDTELSDAEKDSGLADQKINRKITITGSDLTSLALPSGSSLNDKSTVTIYHSPANTGSGKNTLKSDAYTVDTLGTDQIVSGNKSTIRVRMKVVLYRPTDDESQ